MERSELIRRMVSEISDDYENVDQIILPHVTKDCAKLGLAVERSEIVQSLGKLIVDGLAKAYLFAGREPFPTELQGMPPLDRVEEDFKSYFYITKKGLDLHLSDDKWWPFDDDGNPLPNWRLDERSTSG